MSHPSVQAFVTRCIDAPNVSSVRVEHDTTGRIALAHITTTMCANSVLNELGPSELPDGMRWDVICEYCTLHMPHWEP